VASEFYTWSITLQLVRPDEAYPHTISLTIIAETAGQAIHEAKTCLVGRSAASCSAIVKGTKVDT